MHLMPGMPQPPDHDDATDACPGPAPAMSRREFVETFGALAVIVTGTIFLATETEAKGGSVLF